MAALLELNLVMDEGWKSLIYQECFRNTKQVLGSFATVK
jgi:hypothetical protein